MKNIVDNISLGADPELFLFNHDSNEVISAEGIIGGTKENPRRISKDEAYGLQEDNVMVEFNIPPAKTKDEFRDSINFILPSKSSTS